jgi:hypothetical protein
MSIQATMPPKASSASSPCSTARRSRQVGLASVPAPSANQILPPPACRRVHQRWVESAAQPRHADGTCHSRTEPFQTRAEWCRVRNVRVVPTATPSRCLERLAGPAPLALGVSRRDPRERTPQEWSATLDARVGLGTRWREVSALRANASVCLSNTGDKLRSGARVLPRRRGHEAAP